MCAVGEKWVRMVNNTGGGNLNLTWFLNILYVPQKRESEARGVGVFELLEAEAEGVLVGSNGVFCHPYVNPTGVVAPFYNPSAASFFDIRTHNTHADLLRAVYEGVALAAQDCFSAVPVLVELLRLTGGGRAAPSCSRLRRNGNFDLRAETQAT